MNSKLLRKMPKVKGNLIPNAKISDFSWFKVGGNAELLFEPADKEDLYFF